MFELPGPAIITEWSNNKNKNFKGSKDKSISNKILTNKILREFWIKSRKRTRAQKTSMWRTFVLEVFSDQQEITEQKNSAFHGREGKR